MITIKNISSAMVVVASQDLKFRRKLAPGREITLNKEVYDELSFDTGFEHLVKNGFLKLTLPKEEVATIEPVKNVAERDELKKIMADRDVTKFAKIIKNASTATKESIVALAVEMRVTDNAFSALIKQYCDGIDIIDAISAQSES